MDIYLSVNNRDNPAEDLLTIPVLPKEFTVSKPQGGEEFETVNSGQLNLIGVPELKTIAWSSFFPIRDYSYLRDRSMKGFEYGYRIDSWISQKLPIRLIISGTPINMAVSVSDFSYKIAQDGDLYYDITLKELPLVDTAEESEGLTTAQYDELKSLIEANKARIDALAAPMIYNYIDENMPQWAVETVKALCDAGYLQGDEEGNLGLTDNMLRMLVTINRSGGFSTGMVYDYVDDNMPEWGRKTAQMLMDNGYLQLNSNGKLGLTDVTLRILVAIHRSGGFHTGMIYDYMDENMPEYAKATIQKLMDKGFLNGGEGGKLGLTDDMLRILVAVDRAGAFD